MGRDLKALRKNLDELATASPGRLLLRYSWPSLIAMGLNALYAVVDRVFIGQGCGVDAMAGLQLAMPVTMFITAFGPFIGIGHAAMLSIKLGEGNRDAAESLLGELIALKALVFVVLIPLVYLYLDTILGWCGADRVTPGAFEAAKEYLRLVLFSHLFSHIAFGLSAMQRAEGGAIRSMICIVVGFVANMVLDPVFIFDSVKVTVFDRTLTLCPGLGLGIAGAAWATDIAMFVSCLCALSFYWRGVTAVALRLRRIRVYPQFVLRALGIGLAPFLQHLMGSLIVASLQYSFAKWMPDEMSRTAQIASLGVFTSALILVMMPILGAQQGLQPIFGFNWGARNYRRVLVTLKTGFYVTTVLTFIAFVIQAVPPFPTLLARLFISSESPDLIALSAHDLQLSNCMIWCISINVLATTYFQSIGRPTVAIWLSMLRQGVVLLPIIWLLPHFLDDKPFAIWLSMPVSDVICNVVTILPLWLNVRFLRRASERMAVHFADQNRKA